MGKITEVNDGDSGFAARTKINTAIKTVEVSSKLTGDGNIGTALDVAESNVDHDALLNFELNEHINWTAAASDFSTSGTVSGKTVSSAFTTLSDPAGGAINTAMVDDFGGVVITTTTASNAQTIADPTDTTAGKMFVVLNAEVSTDPILINDTPLQSQTRLVIIWDGVSWVNDPLRFPYQSELSSVISTGVILLGPTGVGNVTFDISAGVYIIVDNYTVPSTPKVTRITYPGTTGNALPDIATQFVTYVSLDADGTILLSVVAPTGEALRDLVIVGIVLHFGLTFVEGFDNQNFQIGWDFQVALSEILMTVLPLVELDSDFLFTAASTDLTIQRSAGTEVSTNINRTNRKDPHKFSVVSESLVVFIITTWRDGLGGFHLSNETELISGVYDDGTVQGGSPTEPAGIVTNNRFVNNRIYYTSTQNLTLLQYGEESHANLADALAAISIEDFDKNPQLNDVLFRGWITVKGNASDASDPSEVMFTPVNKFGVPGHG